MDETEFWRLIATLDWRDEGDDDKVVEPLVKALSSMPDSALAGFQNMLASKLYALDGRAWARESGDVIWQGEPNELSVDGFLYARLAVVARGQAFYESVLADPKQMPKNVDFESLMYVASAAYERKTGLDDGGELDMTDVSFETFSNEDGWPKEG